MNTDFINESEKHKVKSVVAKYIKQVNKDKSNTRKKEMEERIKKLGGELSVETSPGRGTRISFRAPLWRENVATENQ